jgi:hypothetical protein
VCNWIPGALPFFYCFGMLLIMQGGAVADEVWRLYKTEAGISMQQRHLQQGRKKLLQVKVQLDYQGSVSAFLHLLNDTNNATLWLHNVAQVKLLAKPSLTEDLVYTGFSAPWPLTERELVSCSQWQQRQI